MDNHETWVVGVEDFLHVGRVDIRSAWVRGKDPQWGQKRKM